MDVDFSGTARAANIERMSREMFDAVIIGAGINGCSIANELAFDGLSVALIDKGDFASGTSQASGLAIWGGIKYLQQLAFGFVARSCHERWLWQQRAPGLVREHRYLFPHYRSDPHGLAAMRAAVWLHYFLGGNGFRTTRPAVFRSAEEIRQRDPRLRAEGLDGGVAYTDAVVVTSDADLTLRVALTAASCGAVCANYIECVGFEKDASGRLAAVRCREKFTGREFELRGRTFINAGGIWADQLNALAGFDDAPHALVLRRGTFLSVPLGKSGREHYLTLLGSDGRPIFGIPWGPVYLIGTTDVEHPADKLNEVRTMPDEVEFILREFNAKLDFGLGRPLGVADIIESRVGVRPLAVSKADRQQARSKEALSLSRDHQVDYSPRLNLYAVLGGKITPARQLAEELAGRMGVRRGASTARQPLYSNVPSDEDAVIHGMMVMTLDDFLRRRTNIGQWMPCGGFGWRDEHAAELLRYAMAIDPVRAAELVEDYRRLVEQRNLWRKAFQ